MAYDNPQGAYDTDASAIRTAAQRIQTLYPHLGPGSRVSSDARDDLRELARDCGLTDVYGPNDADLISVYRVALRDAEIAKRTARKIQLRLHPEAAPNGPSPADLMRAVRDATQPLETRLDAISGDLRADFATLVADASASTLDAMRDALHGAAHKAATEALKSLTPTRLEVQLPNAEPVPLGLVHKLTGEIIEDLADGVNVYLHGPAGSGKTTLAEKVAKAFGVKAYYAAKVEHEYQLMGFVNAKGYVRTQFRDAYEFGGIFLFDEFDASCAAAVVALNMALANGICAFPDGMVTRHPDFKVIAAGNTVLGGATEAYQGRQQLDAASVDRFTFTEFGYDEDLERALASDADWVAYVQAVRAEVARRGFSHLVTPRATIDGCKLLARGTRTWSQVANKVIWKGLDRDTVATLQDATAHAFKGI